MKIRIKDLVRDLTYKEIKERKWARCRIWRKGKKILFSEYIVSTDGKVMRIIENKGGRFFPGKILEGGDNGRGYLIVCLFENKVKTTVAIHRLVWESFNGKVPDELQINHKDGIKVNIHLSNFEILTQSENMKHAYGLGLCISNMKGRYGVGAGGSKLDDKKVSKIRKMYKTGKYTRQELANLFKLKSVNTIRAIIRRDTWPHI